MTDQGLYSYYNIVTDICRLTHMQILRILLVLAGFIEILLRRPVIDPEILETVQAFLSLVLAIPAPLPSVQTRIEELFGRVPFQGRDVYTHWVGHPFQMMRVTGVTPDMFNDLLAEVSPMLPDQDRLLSDANILLLTLLWLRCYPTVCLMCLIFDVSERTIGRYLNMMIPILDAILSPEVIWPTAADWQNYRYVYNNNCRYKV